MLTFILIAALLVFGPKLAVHIHTRGLAAMSASNREACVGGSEVISVREFAAVAAVCLGALAQSACSDDPTNSTDTNTTKTATATAVNTTGGVERYDMSNAPTDVQTAAAVGYEAIKASLKDADTAKFKDRFVSKSGARYVFCGEVNAKNSFGAYEGFRSFIVDQKDETVIIQGDAPAFDLAWAAECADPVLRIDT